MTLPSTLDARAHLFELAAQVVETSAIEPERLATLVTARVGETESDVIYRENKLRLHYYEPETVRQPTPIFVTYALVNRPYVLDLQPDRSVLRQFLEAGFEVYLIDWGNPSRLDQSLSLADHVCRYMNDCVAAALEHADAEDVHLFGYCMGGTLSIMYTALFEEHVRTLSLMATPVAFDGSGGVLERWATHCDTERVVDTLGNVPAELLALAFALLDPVDNFLTKYVQFTENLDDEEFVATFARMEQWIWDGVDVPGETYREFVADLYRDDRLVAGQFTLDGERIDPAAIEVPVLQILGVHDHIVPPESSKPFDDAVGSSDTRVIEFPAGHIGVSVSSSAHERLWPDVCDWLSERSDRRPHDPSHRNPVGSTDGT